MNTLNRFRLRTLTAIALLVVSQIVVAQERESDLESGRALSQYLVAILQQREILENPALDPDFIRQLNLLSEELRREEAAQQSLGTALVSAFKTEYGTVSLSVDFINWITSNIRDQQSVSGLLTRAIEERDNAIVRTAQFCKRIWESTNRLKGAEFKPRRLAQKTNLPGWITEIEYCVPWPVCKIRPDICC